MTLNDATEVDGGALAIGGATAPVTTNVSGQNAHFTFEGTAGQAVAVHMTNSTMGYCCVYLLNPDDTQLVRYDTGFGRSKLPTLPTSGTFTLRIDPYGENKGEHHRRRDQPLSYHRRRAGAHAPPRAAILRVKRKARRPVRDEKQDFTSSAHRRGTRRNASRSARVTPPLS